mmetsp:Transcript_15157/g.28533  ORF Transcript_15157/g.28533 Transcript_15157/m.28533 type:complete len:238 (+) Transcript_15157:966-1679(+)
MHIQHNPTSIFSLNLYTIFILDYIQPLMVTIIVINPKSSFTTMINRSITFIPLILCHPQDSDALMQEGFNDSVIIRRLIEGLLPCIYIHPILNIKLVIKEFSPLYFTLRVFVFRLGSTVATDVHQILLITHASSFHAIESLQILTIQNERGYDIHTHITPVHYTTTTEHPLNLSGRTLQQSVMNALLLSGFTTIMTSNDTLKFRTRRISPPLHHHHLLFAQFGAVFTLRCSIKCLDS